MSETHNRSVPAAGKRLRTDDALHRSVLALVPRLGRFFYHLARDRRVPWTVEAAVVLAVAYVASPVDLIPDWLPGGYLDDVLVFWIVLNYVFAAVPQEVLIEHWQGDVQELRQLTRLRPQTRPAPSEQPRKAA